MCSPLLRAAVQVLPALRGRRCQFQIMVALRGPVDGAHLARFVEESNSGELSMSAVAQAAAKAAEAAKEAEKAESEAAKVYEIVEEDDEFEEFEDEGWMDRKDEQEEKLYWADDWDNDDVNEEFAVQLRQELTATAK